jgi:hypothetical protein
MLVVAWSRAVNWDKSKADMWERQRDVMCRGGQWAGRQTRGRRRRLGKGGDVRLLREVGCRQRVVDQAKPLLLLSMLLSMISKPRSQLLLLLLLLLLLFLLHLFLLLLLLLLYQT